jgi:hypothetical protein
MVDIDKEARRYAEGHPYEVTRIRLPDNKKEIWIRFRITKQPDPEIAAMLGDFVHNLRSALDYIVVACVPKQRRGKAGFPILYEDIFARDKNGDLMVNDTNLINNFETATKGLHPKARAYIIGLQPYQATNLGISTHLNILGVINRLDNPDKHRHIITIGCGGQDFTINFTVRGLSEPIMYHRIVATGEKFLEDNTKIPFVFSSAFPPDGIPQSDGSFVQPSDMEMHLSGTAKILVKVARIGGNLPPDNFLLDDFMDMALSDVQEILTRLEFFVLRT